MKTFDLQSFNKSPRISDDVTNIDSSPNISPSKSEVGPFQQNNDSPIKKS